MRQSTTKIGDRIEQGVGIGVMGGCQQLFAATGFNHLATVHHGNALGQIGDGRDIIADQQDRRVVVLIHPPGWWIPWR